ncbi:MAG: hemerythrin domain-containing protein [Elusimicrobia bacterium]|jgi:hemerythrin-like domain-containing protein|nr:hemerythrin domain-containing protein [Elusimicrobiota bacterium]
MNKASDDLKHEHEVIKLALQILKKMRDRIMEKTEYDAGATASLLEVFSVFADQCHHGKEEKMLFPAMEEAGILKENGPIAVMLAEHVKGREHIAQMRVAIDVDNKSIDTEKFVDAAKNYIELLIPHIEKENNVLFPMGDNVLSDSKQNELLEDFEKYEENVIGHGKHEEFHELLKKLKAEYI